MKKREKKTNVKLKSWVDEFGGATIVARKLKLSRQSIYFWIWGFKTPSSGSAWKLRKLSGGKLTAKDLGV